MVSRPFNNFISSLSYKQDIPDMDVAPIMVTPTTMAIVTTGELQGMGTAIMVLTVLMLIIGYIILHKLFGKHEPNRDIP
jgi:hypothetical protein